MNRPKFNCHLTLAFAVFGMMLASCFSAGYCSAQDPGSGTTSRKAREQAQKIVPFDQLNQEAAQKIRNIVLKPSIYRRLPVASITVDHDYYLHLLRHPEVIINIWELMGVTDMTAERIGPYTLDTDDAAGTVGRVELVYGTNNLQIFYGQGEYNGNMLAKRLRGECVIMVQTQYHLDDQGKPATTSQLDIFMKLENVTLNLIARTLSPLIGTTADHNFVETINFIQRLNETTVKNGPGVQAMAHRMRNLTPEVRKQFVETAGLVYDRARTDGQRGNLSTQVGIEANQVQQNRFATPRAPRAVTQSSYAMNPYQNGSGQSRAAASDRQQPSSYSPRHPAAAYPPAPNRSPRSVPVQQYFGDGNRSAPTRPTQTIRPTSAVQPIYSSRQPSYSPNTFYNR